MLVVWGTLLGIRSPVFSGPVRIGKLCTKHKIGPALKFSLHWVMGVMGNPKSRALRVAKHKMGPAFSHFVVSEGAFLSLSLTFLSALSCTAVHLSAVHMAGFRPTGPRDVVCSRIISPCSGVYPPSPDDAGARWALPEYPRTQGNFPRTHESSMTTTWGERDKRRQTAAAKHDTTDINTQHIPCRSS